MFPFDSVGWALLIARLVLFLGKSLTHWLVAIGVLLGALLLPIWGLPLVGYLRAFMGDLSFTSVGLIVAGAFTEIKVRRNFVRLVVLVAVFFYPMALGISTYDPYQLGFGGSALFLWLILLCVYSVIVGYLVPVYLIVFAVSGYSFGLLESDNLWDYLIDPWLVLAFICYLYKSRKMKIS